MLGIIAVPAVDACAADGRGLVTCLRDMVDRRFNLPGEVSQQQRAPTAQTAPATAPIPVHPAPTISVPIAAAQPAPPEPVAVAEPAPELPKPSAVAGQGGPYIPPAPERVADLRPEPVDPTPAMPPAEPVAPRLVEPLPSTPTADVFSDIEEPPASPVAARPEPIPTSPQAAPSPDVQAAPLAKPAPQPSMAVVPPEPKPPVLAATSEPAEASPSAGTTYELPPPPVFPPTQQSAELPAPAAPKPAETTVAAGPEIPPVQPQPKVTAPVALAPTIDAIELEGTRSFVSGSGPAGAVMRLFADDEMIGESPVEEGRWLVETGPLLSAPKRELKIEAVDPDTGKSLGQTVITVEIELEPDSPSSKPDAAPPAATPPAPEPVAPAEPAIKPEPEAPEITQSPPDPLEPPAQPEPEPEPPVVAPQEPDAQQEVPNEAPSEPAVEAEPEPEPTAEPLPQLLPTRPERETASVTILEAPGASTSVATLGPRKPALVAAFEAPRPRPPGQPVTVLKLVPFGDPVNGRFTGGKAIIRHGDTLWTLAHRYYGAGIHYRTIFDANRDQIRRPSRIFPGQIFDLPLVTND